MITRLIEAETAHKIDDLYLSGYLACEGIVPEAVETTDRGRRHFIYSDDADRRVQELIDRFYSGRVDVALPILRARIKDMKELICRGR
jgi:hypothetical protein